MRRPLSLTITGLASATVLAALAGCGNSSTATSSSHPAGPIQVGSIATITGYGNFFSQASEGAKAYLSYVNSQGGIGGRKFTYTLLDDKGTPAAAASDARELAAMGAVAIVGDASQLNCAVNARYYQQAGIADIPALGFTSACYQAANISPVDVGLFSGLELDLVYATQVMHLHRVCALTGNLPGYAAAMAPKIAAWEKISGQKLAYYSGSLPVTPDYTPYVVAMKNAGCTAVALALPGTVQPLLQALRDQGAAGIKVLTVATSYSAATAKVAAGYPQTEVQTISQFVPFDSTQPAAVQYRKVMAKYGLQANATTEAGYVAAEAFVAAVHTIKGPITRQSVLKALQDLEPVRIPLMGPEYSFGPGAAHQSNTSGIFLQARNAVWQQVTTGFVKI